MQLAVFDLDGTITHRDTLLPYVMGFPMSAPRKYLGMLYSLLDRLLLFVLRLRDHGDVKSAFIRSTLRGQPRAKIEA